MHHMCHKRGKGGGAGWGNLPMQGAWCAPVIAARGPGFALADALPASLRLRRGPWLSWSVLAPRSPGPAPCPQARRCS
eukprot:4403139-Prymnesium_polylepis.1